MFISKHITRAYARLWDERQAVRPIETAAAVAGPHPRPSPRGGGLVASRDERGSISIVSVFAVLFLAMLLGMVMNVGRHVDGKLRMQNAADAAAYSGGVVLGAGHEHAGLHQQPALRRVRRHRRLCARPATRIRPPTRRRSWPPGARWPRSSPPRAFPSSRPWARPSSKRSRWSSRWSIATRPGPSR